MFDVKKWLMEDMKFSEAEATEMLPRFTAERAGVIESSLGLRSQLTARETEIATTQQQLKEANDRLNNEMAEWASLTQAERAAANDLRTSLEAARVRTVQLESRLTDLAKQHGVDPKTLLEGTTPVPDQKAKPDPGDPDPRYVGMDRFGTALTYAIDLPANLLYIQQQHLELTGDHLDTRDIVKAVKENANKKDGIVDPVALWEQKYDIPGKRAAKQKADFDRQIAEAEARGEERARSAQALPNAAPPGKHAPVFGSRGSDGRFQPRTSALQRPQPGSSTQSAVSALRSGKYRQQKAS